MKLIITRHGETEENRAGVLMEHSPGKLTIKGLKQAKKLSLKLKREKLDFIYSSDLKRSSDTTKEIAKFHPNTPIKLTKELRERHLGEFEGKHKSEVGWNPKKGESLKNLYKRAEKFLHKIISKHHEDTILFVSHDVVNKAFVAVITGKKYVDIKNMKDHDNTSLTIFKIDKNKKPQSNHI